MIQLQLRATDKLSLILLHASHDLTVIGLPFYISLTGIMHGVSALGGAMGFLFGGIMLHYYVDCDKVDMST